MRSDVTSNELETAAYEARLMDDAAGELTNLVPKLANLLVAVRDHKQRDNSLADVIKYCNAINPNCNNYNVAIKLICQDINKQIRKLQNANERVDEIIGTESV